jgi:hypothetical protein
VVDGDKSGNGDVLSGVPQGTVLGPVLFLVYINDIADDLDSSIRLFADDCLLYREVKNANDQQLLQNDLDTLHTWASKWQMSFNVDKCYTMQVSLARKNKRACTYSMGGQDLADTKTTPYLGVTLSNDLKWNSHINIITAKARRMLGMLRRNLSQTPTKIKETAYKTLVRPRLEYCSPIWDPYQQDNIRKIETT